MRLPRAAGEVYAEMRPRTSDADCCVYARDVLVRAYGLPDPTPELEALWCVHLGDDGTVPASRVWGPTQAAIESDIAVALVGEPLPGRWHLCQGWRSLRADGRADPRHDQGHTWLWYAASDDIGVVLDSARDRGARVEGWQSWARRLDTYAAGIRVALLRAPPRG